MERVAGIEPASQPWEGRIIAIILYPPVRTFKGVDVVRGLLYTERVQLQEEIPFHDSFQERFENVST